KKVITQKEDYTRAYIEIRDVENVVLKQPYYVLASIYHQELLPEDEIYASSSIKAISPPHNTGQFDMKSYYAYKWVFQTTSIYPNNFIKSENFSKISVLRWSFLASKWCSSVFKKYLPERSASTMQALLLGKKDGVNEDMKKVYMRDGVMHVIAVSGCNVGILYLY